MPRYLLALIAAFAYRPVIVQKIIHMLLAQYKSFLAEMEGNNTETINGSNDVTTAATATPASNVNKRTDTSAQTQHLDAYAMLINVAS
jgi:hypothetical protein